MSPQKVTDRKAYRGAEILYEQSIKKKCRDRENVDSTELDTHPCRIQ